MKRLVIPSLLALVAVCVLGCGAEPSSVPVPDRDGAFKTAAAERAGRRLYDGAPPVIPHGKQGAACVSCHNQEGMAVEGLGFAPPSPHEKTQGLSAIAWCQQCHVFSGDSAPRVANDFEGLRQDLRRGERLHDLAPPVIPHKVFMRENCQACHAGPAAREEIRTDHPERLQCKQCHVEQVTTQPFSL
jgi:cytochrome c-type protein NapB